MYLKNVTMVGFKSFADKISLDFNTGVTAIVGPNGSGKSNISDAIRWVMGEMSAKSLRGAKLQDVIFAGTAKRKAIGYAEVTLTLDNQQKLLPVDFAEVSVTRRVYRSGETEYFINKASCRLRDIHELFMDTGIGREGYSIIGQGRIDSILSTKSEDRRQVFEEAAGITKYKYRKTEAERKLASTEDNLIRLRDILLEIESSLDTLKAQSEKAKKYLNMREQLKALELNLAVHAIDNLRQALTGVKSDLDIAGDAVNSASAQIEAVDRETEQLYSMQKELSAKLEECRNTEKSLSDSVNSCNNDINMFRVNITHNTENIARLEDEIKSERERLIQLDGEYNLAKVILSDFRTAKAEVDKNASELFAKASEVLRLTEEKNNEIETLKLEILQKTSNIHNQKSSIENMNHLLSNYEERIAVLVKEIEDKSKSVLEFENNTQTLEQRIEELKHNLQAYEKESEEQRSIKAAAEHELKELQRDNVAANMERSNAISGKSMLEDMEKSYEGYHRSVKSVMRAAQNGYLHGIYAPLSQMIETEYVTAIETALAASAQNIVVRNEEDGKAAIAYLKKNNLGRATFLPISAVRGKEMNPSDFMGLHGYIGIASQLTRYKPEYNISQEILWNTLGRTIVFDNIDNAVIAARKTGYKHRIVTLSGDVLNAGGAMSGGSLSKSGGFLSRADEIERLNKRIMELDSIILNYEVKDEALSNTIHTATERINDITHKHTEQERDFIKTSAELTHYQAFLNNTSQALSVLNNEKEQLSVGIDNINSDISGKHNGIRNDEACITELESRLAIRQEEFKQFADSRDKVNAELMEINIRKTNAARDIELQSERMDIAEVGRNECKDRIDGKLSDIADIKNRINDIEDDIAFKNQQLQELNEDCEKTVERLNGYTQNLHEVEECIKTKQTESRRLREELFKLQQEYGKIENKKIKIDTELENVINKMWEDYELTYEGALPYKSEIKNINTENARVATLRNELRDLGSVNVDSIDEYKTTHERYSFLNEQTADLEKGKAELENIINDITVIMRKQFKERFEAINKNFASVFRELFGGGNASVYMTEPSNILECGIEIEAQPPGKKLQSLSLLSGGERAFTAIALLFAILRVRPSPFCMLDEIEAALDDVNVYRFAQYLKKLGRDTQFIVITHRRGTMECAGTLYGVTMQERGISKLLSINIDDIEAEFIAM